MRAIAAAPVALVVKAALPGSVVVFGTRWDGEDYVAETVPSGAHEGVTAIATGGQHTIALKQDGTVLPWGNNDFGQATPPPNLSGVAALAAGWYHSVALRKDGAVVVWGHNAPPNRREAE